MVLDRVCYGATSSDEKSMIKDLNGDFETPFPSMRFYSPLLLLSTIVGDEMRSRESTKKRHLGKASEVTREFRAITHQACTSCSAAGTDIHPSSLPDCIISQTTHVKPSRYQVQTESRIPTVLVKIISVPPCQSQFDGLFWAMTEHEPFALRAPSAFRLGR
jgi:hypothetical protein